MSQLRRMARTAGRSVLSVRALWVVMLLVHLPGLWAAWHAVLRDGFETVRPFSLASLTIAALFFALKVYGWRVLRFETDARSLLVVLMAVVLLHANAVGAWLDVGAVPQELPVAATVLMATGLSQVQLLARTLLSDAVGGRRAPILGPRHALAPATVCPRPRRLPRCRTPRAPPLSHT